MVLLFVFTLFLLLLCSELVDVILNFVLAAGRTDRAGPLEFQLSASVLVLSSSSSLLVLSVDIQWNKLAGLCPHVFIICRWAKNENLNYIDSMNASLCSILMQHSYLWTLRCCGGLLVTGGAPWRRDTWVAWGDQWGDDLKLGSSVLFFIAVLLDLLVKLVCLVVLR